MMPEPIVIDGLYEDTVTIWGPGHKEEDPTIYLELEEYTGSDNPRPRDFDLFLTIEQAERLVEVLQDVIKEATSE
jgi:hypothetical protein